MDWETVEAVCVRMSRDTYSRSTFLDDRTISTDGEEHRVPVASVMDAFNANPPARRPVMFVAHTALCGSTLLSRCLDFPGVCLPYKEPYLLHNLSGIWRLGLQKQLHAKVGRSRPHISPSSPGTPDHGSCCCITDFAAFSSRCCDTPVDASTPETCRSGPRQTCGSSVAMTCWPNAN
jgi:hypothetical protein